MIEVRDLARSFGPRRAVDGLSFTVRRGETVAFLGPNGAGKSTTLRILAGFLPPTSGSASIGGLDVVRASKPARRLLGYMPETVPLYPEMSVQGYLRFRARLKGVPRARAAARVADVAERCRLQDVLRRPIGALSRGYRQRVGLADALVADPPALVLDEPTAGLDPNQVLEARRIVRELRPSRALLLSTHILREAEAVADRVLILHRGRLVAEGTPSELGAGPLRGGNAVRVEGIAPGPEAAAALRELAGGGTVEVLREADPFRARIAGGEDAALRAEVFRLFAARGWTLTELRPEAPSLEEVFARVTAGGEGA